MVAIVGAAVAAVGSIASGVIGGAAQGKAATKARRAQETAATQQLQQSWHQWSHEQVQRQPWIDAGRTGLANMAATAEFSRDNPNTWYQRGGPDPHNYRWQSAGSSDGHGLPATADGGPEPIPL